MGKYFNTLLDEVNHKMTKKKPLMSFNSYHYYKEKGDPIECLINQPSMYMQEPDKILFRKDYLLFKYRFDLLSNISENFNCIAPYKNLVCEYFTDTGMMALFILSGFTIRQTTYVSAYFNDQD